MIAAEQGERRAEVERPSCSAIQRAASSAAAISRSAIADRKAL
jgi:hypothetical protein